MSDPAAPTPEADPFALFDAWLRAAESLVPTLPEAAALATATADGRPSVRMVLFKGLAEQRLCFFGNYRSRKGQELEANPQAALLFHWRELQRQIRVEGTVERLSPQASDAYFATRPRESQIGALASPQSQVIESFEALELRVLELAREHQGRPVPRPRDWGGWGLVPEVWEFWVGRQWRLHERWRYRRDLSAASGWRCERLAP